MRAIDIKEKGAYWCYDKKYGWGVVDFDGDLLYGGECPWVPSPEDDCEYFGPLTPPDSLLNLQSNSASPERAMTIAKTITEYRDTKQAMQAIIDRHMRAAFAEIKQEFGDTPTSVYVNTVEQQDISQQYPSGVYDCCEVKLGGE